MDFYQIRVKEVKDGTLQVYPDWTVGRSTDLMIRGRSFYAVWDEANNIWSTDEYDVQRLVDEDLHRYVNENAGSGAVYQVLNLRSFTTNIWTTFRKFMMNISDNSRELDTKLTFANTKVTKEDYVSKRLPYDLAEGSIDAWEELVSTLYSEEERAKIEWAIGAVVSGDSQFIQKFLVFYGPAGSGKSTILNIIHMLFADYATTFDARALGANNNTFSTEVFKSNPLVAIQHDGDLSKIEDNTKLNSIISHEEMTVNEKFKPSYTSRVRAFLFMGTNQPVKISDAKSGLVRRLIDVHPSGDKIDSDRYHILMDQIKFELGPIAYHCLGRYRSMGKNYYSEYRPIEMMLQTDIFYNYVEAHFDIFGRQDGIALKRAYALYKEFCTDTGIERVLPQYKFREELRNYFTSFQDRVTIDGVTVRSYYSGFKDLVPPKVEGQKEDFEIILEDAVEAGDSIFDQAYPDQPAQYAKPSGYPAKRWSDNNAVLRELDTHKLHWVQVPEQHIVIDFDLVNEDGEKDFEKSRKAASLWPPTYTEVSQSGSGIHLHYIYNGDVHQLASVFDVGIEVKTLLGDQSLRRRLTKCNRLAIAKISGGLPKKEKKMLDVTGVKSEKALRDLIDRNLRKEIHPGTKSSVDFIKKILDDAYEDGLSYNVEDMRSVLITFAAKSSNQSKTALKTVQEMKFVGQSNIEEIVPDDDAPVVFFDVEVYPNLFVVCWKAEDAPNVTRMVNPTSQQIEELLSLKLVGFFNRQYDNHILYARLLGYPNKDLFRLSQRITSGDRSASFGEAYGISYTDIYDFSSVKQGLKKFMIKLGIHHVELDIPWDEPVPEELWDRVVSYCENDVRATEAVWKDRRQDFVARQILAEISGLSVNHTTQNHTAKIIFDGDKNPQSSFNYTDLSKTFKGYNFDGKESTYRNEVVGEGGYVYSEPGIHESVALLDVASMHPTSIEQLNLFGPYTKRFSALKEARMAIKHGDFTKARGLLDGRLAKFIGDSETDAESTEALSYALKIVINIVYGLTSARFPNPFRDNRNVDNIVAKRGALFMIDLKHAVQERGFTVAHVKTDSIKIPGATCEIIEFVKDFGARYGYDFEHEATYDKFCLVNDAVYVAWYDDETGRHWSTVGAQFQHPYVRKALFTNEPHVFDDFCEIRNVTKGRMYLDFDDAGCVSGMKHVGRTGSFVPVLEGGGVLLRVNEDKHHSVTGTKGHRWIERDIAKDREESGELFIDMNYFDQLENEARLAIDKFGSVHDFLT